MAPPPGPVHVACPCGRNGRGGGGLVMSTLANSAAQVWQPGPSINLGYRVYSNGWIRGFSIGRTF